MSNNYIFGSKGLGLKNTFKLDGILYVIVGLIVLILGSCLLYLFSEKAFEFSLEYSATKSVAIVKIIGGGYLIFLSLYLLSIGVRKIFCDFESADVPADLTKFDTYLPKQLIEMLQKGKVPFKKNVGILEEFTNSIIKNFKYTPLPIHTITQNIFNGLFQVLFLLFLYCIATFSGFSFHPIVKSWIEIILLFWIVFILLKYKPRKNKKGAIIKKRISIKLLAFYICIAFIGPIILSQMYSIGYLPKLPGGGQRIWLAVVVIFIVYTATISFLFILLRGKEQFSINIAEFKKNFTVKASPNDIYLGFEDAMTELQYRSDGATWPNRVYLDEPPVIDQNNKFIARKLLESQPVSESKLDNIPYHKNIKYFYRLKVITTITVHLLILSAVLWLFFCIYRFGTVSYEVFLEQLFFTMKAPTIFLIFTYLLNKISFYYWGEFLFKSELTFFEIKGTYYKAIQKNNPYVQPTQSSDIVYGGQSVFTMRIYSTTLSSTTFFESKNKQLNGPRYISCMNRNDSYIESILNAMRQNIVIINEQLAGYQPALNTASFNQIQNVSNQLQIQTTTIHKQPLQIQNQSQKFNKPTMKAHSKYQKSKNTVKAKGLSKVLDSIKKN